MSQSSRIPNSQKPLRYSSRGQKKTKELSRFIFIFEEREMHEPRTTKTYQYSILARYYRSQLFTFKYTCRDDSYQLMELLQRKVLHHPTHKPSELFRGIILIE